MADIEPIFKSMTTRGQSLSQFIEGWKKNDADFLKKCNSLVDKFVHFLHITPYSISKTVKGGSIGKATFITPHSDIDIIFFINEVTSVEQLSGKMDQILDIIQRELETKWNPMAGQVEFIRRTKHGLQYRLSSSELDQIHDVDILPAFNVLKDRDVKDVYKDMSELERKAQAFYSVCFATLQIEFIKLAPVKVKDLIRLLKYWAKKEVNENEKVITSYCLECIVMYRWQKWNRPVAFNLDEKFDEIIKILADLNSIRIIWEDKYAVELYTKIPETPVILDPANPFINLAPHKLEHQQIVITKAKQVAQRFYKYRQAKGHVP